MDILQITARPVTGGESFGRPNLGTHPQPDVGTASVKPTDKAPPGSTTRTSNPQKEVDPQGPKSPENLLDLLKNLVGTSTEDSSASSLVAKLGDNKVQATLQVATLPPSLDTLLTALASIGVAVPQPTVATLGTPQAAVRAIQASDSPQVVKDVLSSLIRLSSNPMPASDLIDMQRPNTPSPTPSVPDATNVLAKGPRPRGSAELLPQPIDVPDATKGSGPKPMPFGTAHLVPQPIDVPDTSGKSAKTPVPIGKVLAEPQPIIVPKPTAAGEATTPEPMGHVNIHGQIQESGKHFDQSIVKWLGFTSMEVTGTADVIGAGSQPRPLGHPVMGTSSDMEGTAGVIGANIGPRPLGHPVPGTIKPRPEIGPMPTPKPPVRTGVDEVPVSIGGPAVLGRPDVSADVPEAAVLVPDATHINPKLDVTPDPLLGKKADGVGVVPRYEEPVTSGTVSTPGAPGTKSSLPMTSPGIDRPVPFGSAINPVDVFRELFDDDKTKDSVGSTESASDTPRVPEVGGTVTVPKPTNIVLPKPIVDSVQSQIADRIETMVNARRSGTVKIRLNPDDLGSVTLTVRNFGSRIDTDIKASNDDVRAALQLNRHDLVRNVESRGLSLNSFHIGQEGQGQSNPQGQRSEFLDAQRSANLRLSAEPVANVTPGPVPSGTTMAVDYLA